MATFTNYCDSGSKAKRYALRLTLNYGEKNVSTNKTPISYSLELAGASYFGLSVDYTGSSFYGYTCNGAITIKNSSTGATLATASGSSSGKVSSSNVITIASGSTEVPHNPDGSLTLSVSGTFTGGLSSQTNGGSVSGSVTLPTIPRKSSVEASACDIEGSTTIKIGNLGGFKHTLKLQFGSLTRYVTDSGGLSTSSATLTKNEYNVIIPYEWYAQIPNSPSGTCNVTCTTYNGSSSLGDTSTTFTVTANKEKSKPKIDFGAMRVTADNGDIYNVEVDNDTFVKHFSKIRIDDGIYPQNYATLKTTTITNGTQTVDGYYNSEGVLAITLPHAITSSAITFNVTDSRNYPHSDTYTIPSDKYIPYEFPSLNANFVRNLPTDGIVNLKITNGYYYHGTIGGESNSPSFQYRYREVKQELWSDFIDLDVSYNYGVISEQEITLDAEFDYKKSYEFQLIYWDVLTQNSLNDSISMGIPVFWWNKEKFVVNGNIYQTNEEGVEIPVGSGGGDTLPVGTIVEYDGNEVPNGFEEIQDVNVKQRWAYNSFSYNSISTGGWSLVAPFVTTETLPKGRYLAIYNLGMYAGGNGVITANIGFNNARLDAWNRASMPLASGLNTNTEMTYYFELDEAKTVSLSAYVYSNVSCSVNSFRVDVIQLDSEEAGIIVENAEEYSYDEQVIGKWVNGKPLYRKTINIGALPNKATKTINHNIADISTIVRLYGYATNYTNYIPLPYSHSDTIGLSVVLYATKTQVGVQTGADRSAYAQAEITIEYVKSTDVAS